MRSPLWNTPLWKHFYQTFTPTCTLCEACARYYHKRNTNIPVNEKRYQRLQAKKKTAYEMVRPNKNCWLRARWPAGVVIIR